MVEERIFWVAWSQIHGMGPVLQKRLAAHFETLEAAWQASPNELQQVEGIGSKLATAIAQQRPLIQLDAVAQDASPFLTPADVAYPRVLYEIPDPPPVLYYCGQLALLAACQSQPGIGVVGTRRPSDYGKHWTRRLTTALSRAGFPIISGLADGIDREAHQSCLKAGGQTIAVLGTGTDVTYPYGNRTLQAEIGRSGLLLSEYPPGTGPDRSHFPSRNRIIAGLSRAVLVTEAPRKSGALITARLANDYGRDVYALPGALDNHQCHGCLDLVNQGAQLITGEKMLIEALGGIPVESQPEAKATAPPDLPPLLLQVFQALGTQPQPLDAIVQNTQALSTGDVLGALTQLELMSLASSLPGTQQYQRRSTQAP